MKKLVGAALQRLSVDEFKQANKWPFAVVLDNVRSMNNVGSVMRTCDAFLCDSLYLCGITATPPHRDITKTAIGAENSVNWIYSQSTMDAVRALKEQGFLVYAVEQTSDSVLLQNMQFNQTPVAFVFGNEIDGVDEAVIKACDGVIEIPQLGTKHSFNISVSCGMLLWEYARTRV
ncbi:MAG: RNA methyltransferase [Sphingomonadales bacterium]|nr:RNA methyltransferase [Sphingomonadales bacterium]